MEIKKLIGDRVLVEIIVQEEKTASGIFLPVNSSKKSLQGKVLMIGASVKYIKEGDSVKHYDHCGATIEYQGKNCLILKESTEIEVIL